MNTVVGVLFLVLAFAVYQQWFYMQKIEDLLDRLMARDINELKAAQKKPAPTPRQVKFQQPELTENFDRILG